MARFGHSRRDELAAAKLDALGVDWDRSRGAYRQYRDLSVGQREQAIASLQARDVGYRPGGRRQGEANPRRQAARATEGRYPSPRQTRRVGADRVALTGDQRTVLGLIRDAAARGDRVMIRATFRHPERGVPMTKDLDRAGERIAVMAAADAAGRGSFGKGGRPRPLAPVTVTAGPDVSGPNGPAFTAGEWLALIDAFAGDVWAAIYALWLADY